jgi:CBS domain-containing protein
VRTVPRDVWENTPVGEIMRDCSETNSVHPDDDAMHALMHMNRTGNSRMLVTEEGRLVGIVALKDLLKFLSLKMDLEK